MSDIMEIEIEASTTSGINVTLTKNKRKDPVWEHFEFDEAKKIFFVTIAKEKIDMRLIIQQIIIPVQASPNAIYRENTI